MLCWGRSYICIQAPIAKELPLMLANRPMISDTAAPSAANTEVQSTRAGAGDEGCFLFFILRGRLNEHVYVLFSC